jgi:hypothetical protein
MKPMTLGHQFYPSDDGSKSKTPPESPLEELLDSHILNRPWFSRWVHSLLRYSGVAQNSNGL